MHPTLLVQRRHRLGPRLALECAWRAPTASPPAGSPGPHHAASTSAPPWFTSATRRSALVPLHRGRCAARLPSRSGRHPLARIASSITQALPVLRRPHCAHSPRTTTIPQASDVRLARHRRIDRDDDPAEQVGRAPAPAARSSHRQASTARLPHRPAAHRPSSCLPQPGARHSAAPPLQGRTPPDRPGSPSVGACVATVEGFFMMDFNTATLLRRGRDNLLRVPLPAAARTAAWSQASSAFFHLASSSTQAASNCGPRRLSGSCAENTCAIAPFGQTSRRRVASHSGRRSGGVTGHDAAVAKDHHLAHLVQRLAHQRHPFAAPGIHRPRAFDLRAHPFSARTGFSRPAPPHDNPCSPSAIWRQLVRQGPEIEHPWQGCQGVIAQPVQKRVNVRLRRGAKPGGARFRRARRVGRAFRLRQTRQLACGVSQLCSFLP